MALELTISEQGGARRQQVVPKDVVFLGRREDNDVVLPYSFVSSRHGRVFRRDGSVFVEDMGSTNGIFVNGDALSPMVPRTLGPEDRIEIEQIVIQARWVEEDTARDLATFHEALPTPPPPASPAIEGGTVRLSSAALASGATSLGSRTPAAAAAAAAPAAAAISTPAPLAPASAPTPTPLAAPRTTTTTAPPAEELVPPPVAPPATMWEIQTGALGAAPAPEPATESGSVLRQASLDEVLGSSRALQRLRAEAGDDFGIWVLVFRAIGVLTILGGIALLVFVLAA
jgi:predicted component of type VI protein secretion system